MTPFPTSRRGFLQAAATLVATGALPMPARPAAEASRIHFVGDSESWRVEDPCAWALANRESLPVLQRARQRLDTLTPDDAERALKVVLRRCPVVLVEVMGDAVTVHQWTSTANADPRWFFKANRLARPEMAVTLRHRKKEQSVPRRGSDFLYWDAVDDDFPLDRFAAKRANRFNRDADDDEPAPGTRSGYGWEGVPGERIPWRALKDAWIKGPEVICPNCDTPAIMTNFGYRQISFFNCAGTLAHACPRCRRQDTGTAVHHSSWSSRAFIENLEPANRPVRFHFHGVRPITPGHGHVAMGTDRLNS
ncbi:MAG: twin-arginine translocation signal domain-containing protein [Planctomycetota bacterium]